MTAVTPEQALLDLTAATDHLASALTGLSGTAARAPSLLPGWTRGHVLAHLAQNAEGGARLLGWARTGVPSYQYESLDARTAGIEAAAGRPAKVLASEFQRTAMQFADAAAAMPPGAWQRAVRYSGGEEPKAAVIVPARLAEVLIHHVDLGTGYGPADWPAPFVSDLLSRIARSGGAGDPGPPRGTVADHDLLAWLLGRPSSSASSRPPAGPLPPFTVLYG